MSADLGWPLIIVLIAVWILIRIERPRDILPPPSKDTQRGNDAGWWS
jgi:hypothetical protein